jgi:hypothetical protein
MARQRKEPKKKLPAGVDQTFVDEIERLDTDSLKGRIVQLQVAKETNDEFKKSQGYLDAKSEYDLVAGPVRDLDKAIKNKTKLIIDQLKQKGAI